MRKALYLDGGRPPPRVVLDGPALRIRRESRADVRAPLRLLSRVIVKGPTSWHTGALLGCMDACVPITFVAADGSAIGWCVGAKEAEDDINELLEECGIRQERAGRHEDWLRGMERRAIMASWPRSWAAAPSSRTGEVQSAWETHLERLRSPVEPALIMSTLRGALEAHLLDLFGRARVSGRFATGHGTTWRLVADFSRVLVWALWPTAERSALYFCRHAGKHPQPRDARRRIVRHYEAIAPLVEQRFRDLFSRLRQNLRDMVA